MYDRFGPREFFFYWREERRDRNKKRRSDVRSLTFETKRVCVILARMDIGFFSHSGFCALIAWRFAEFQEAFYLFVQLVRYFWQLFIFVMCSFHRKIVKY